MKRVSFLVTLLLVLGVWVLVEAANPPKDTNLYDINLLNGVVKDDSVRVTNVIITGIDTNPAVYGFWAQELAGGPHSGMLIYTGSLYPTNFRRGHLMRVTGKYTEFPGPDTSNSASEINSFYSSQLDTLGTAPVPDPVLLSCSNLGYWPADAPRAEQWEGVLIKVDTVIVVNGAGDYPRNYVIREAHSHAGAGLGDTVYVRNDKMDANAPIRLADGDTLASLTGAWYFEYGQYRLCPRDADDIVPLHSPSPHLLRAYATSNTSIDAVFDARLEKTSAEDIYNYSLGSGTATITGASLDPVGEQTVTLTTITQVPGTYETVFACCIKSKGGTLMPAPQQYSFRGGLCPISMVQTPKSAENDSSQYAGDEVTVAGIVTGDKTDFTTEFYMETTPGGPWSGIVIYGGISSPVAQGDSVIIAGFVAEYYNDTEITPVHYLGIVSHGNTIPGPDLLAAGQLNGQSSPWAERWEGVFVRMNPAFVYDTLGWAGFGEWAIWDLKSPADSTKIGHTGKYTYVPRVGRWMCIQGPVSYTYGNYRIEPRTDADIDTVWGCVGSVDPGTQPKPPAFALEQNSPNPFNPVTSIFFSIPEKADVDLYVYDISGRVVKRLVDGVSMEPGRHKATWDGRNDAGRAVSSGVYFCKLLAGDKVAQMKMVILK
jgi:hypothetical protein